MPQFTYKARRRSGEVVQGMLDVADRAAALQQIERLGLFPVMVDAARGAASASPGPSSNNGAGRAGDKEKKTAASLLPESFRSTFRRTRRPKMQELATFTQQLANLLNSGMPLTVALNSMTHLESKGIPSDVSKGLKQEVMEGRGLSDAMSKQPNVFSDLYVNMVRAGEQSGALTDVLRRLATHYERFAEVQSKFKSAMIYPMIVGVVGVAIIIFFMTFMLPKFMEIFNGLNIELPWSTQLLMGSSRMFTRYWWLLLFTTVAVWVVLARFKSSAAGRYRIDQWMLNAPVFGKVIRLNLFGQFARTLSTLLTNGVPVLTALKITEQIIPNVVVKSAIALTREEVTDGKTIAQPLAKSKLFPQLMLDLLKIGEETGDVPGALRNVADTYENELNIQLRIMTTLIEPAMIIVMALGVGFLLFSVLSAMFKITSSINR
ncbi:MAG TPA: type II secretion system protein [Verrucomicrobiales bacterium]|nr:type II secretion system protein [Verrucomicrobiales bacterium]